MSDETGPKPAETNPAPPFQPQSDVQVVKTIAEGIEEPKPLDEAKAMVADAVEGEVTTALNMDAAPAAVSLPVALAASIASTPATGPGESAVEQKYRRVMGRLARIEIENYRVFRG